MSHYYHAGVDLGRGVIWSDHTRRSQDAAEAEARRMERRSGGRALVEYWDARHGLRPGDCALVAGAYYLDEVAS